MHPTNGWLLAAADSQRLGILVPSWCHPVFLAGGQLAAAAPPPQQLYLPTAAVEYDQCVLSVYLCHCPAPSGDSLGNARMRTCICRLACNCSSLLTFLCLGPIECLNKSATNGKALPGRVGIRHLPCKQYPRVMPPRPRGIPPTCQAPQELRRLCHLRRRPQLKLRTGVRTACTKPPSTRLPPEAECEGAGEHLLELPKPKPMPVRAPASGVGGCALHAAHSLL